MTIRAVGPMVECATLIETTLIPQLQRVGVASIDIVASGSPRAGRYSAAPGMMPRAGEVMEVVKIYFPGSLTCQMLQVVPIEKLKIPETDPSIRDAQREIRRPTWQMVVFFGVLVSIAAFFLLGPLLFGAASSWSARRCAELAPPKPVSPPAAARTRSGRRSTAPGAAEPARRPCARSCRCTTRST